MVPEFPGPGSMVRCMFRNAFLYFEERESLDHRDLVLSNKQVGA